MSNTVSGGFVACHYPSKQGPIGGLLWKTTATLVGTSLSIEPGNLVDGVVTDVWLDPGTLKATATIKGYMQDDGLSTPTYFLDYTVPNPAVETRAALNARLRVHGKLQIDIAGATAADTVVIYVFVDPHADTGVILGAATDGTYIGDIKFGESLPSGTALMGKVGIDQVTANANEVVVKSALPAGTAHIGETDTKDATLTVKGYRQITTLTSATPLTVPPGSTKALIIPMVQTVRWRDDGTNPTASVGMPLVPYAAVWYTGDLAAIKFIETVAGAKLNIAYYA